MVRTSRSWTSAAAWLTLLACWLLPGAAWASGSVYVTNFDSNFVPSTVSQYATGAGGELSPLTPATVGAGINPIGIAVSPDGKSVYDIDPLSGVLSPKTPAAVAAGDAPWGVAVGPAQESLAVEIGPTARLIQGGKAVAVQVTVACATGAEVLEAFVYVNQDGNQGEFASFQPICDGTSHTFIVRAQALGFRYHVGAATVSGYVLLNSGASISPTQTVTLHRGPS